MTKPSVQLVLWPYHPTGVERFARWLIARRLLDLRYRTLRADALQWFMGPGQEICNLLRLSMPDLVRPVLEMDYLVRYPGGRTCLASRLECYDDSSKHHIVTGEVADVGDQLG